tara:strand:- start:904 stop:2049 length:1146 start_codon:yes stop_codon:yes gene_type:complete
MDGKSLRSLNESVSRILFEEDGKSSQQKKIGTYRTRFFHLCPGAQQIFPEIEDEIGGKDAGALAAMADKIFEIEDGVLKAGEPSEEASSAAREVYGQMMKAARKFGVDEKLDFMQGHLDIIDKGSKDEEDEEKPGMRGFAGDMGGALDGGMVDGGMGNGGAMGESYLMEKMDPVGKEDKDVDNDGDVDDSDEYLMKRRKAIGKAMAKRKVQERKSQIIGTLLSEDKKVNEAHDAHADFHQHLDDSGVLLAKDHKEHGIKQMELGYDDKIAYSFSSDKYPGLSDPHTFHDVENEGVSAVGFLPKGGLNLDPQKVRAERMMTREHEGLIKKHDIRDIDAKYRNQNESYTPKDLREATMNRINRVSKQIKRDNSDPIMDRLRGI